MKDKGKQCLIGKCQLISVEEIKELVSLFSNN